ncbi:MAG: HAMP domain-containing histidine kinase [Prolixibacteraceae bacterium]|nr:HAMP domain-containing histidine kinase [Prolixibacteraceae bacterium]
MKFIISKRLIATTIFMSLILVLIIILIINVINEKNKIQSALILSQQNREQIQRTESIMESLFLVEISFNEYCTTYEQSVFGKYKEQIGILVANIDLLRQSMISDSIDENRIVKIFDEKNKEVDIYLKLKLLTDSLIFSSVVLEENQAEIKKYIGSRSAKGIDTLSVTKTTELYRKGLLGKLKTLIVGEKIQQNVNTKMVVQSSGELTNQNPDLHALRLSSGLPAPNAGGSVNNQKLIQMTYELKQSELNLIRLNNRLIAEISKLINEVKGNIRSIEIKRNDSFLSSVRNSTNFLQNILIVLMILACILALYILILAYKNARFQKSIVDLNKKVTKDSIEKDKFFSIIGHDLMNPFNALLGFNEILIEAIRKDDKEESIEYSEIIRQSSRRILDLLQNLLVWSRMQNGTMKYVPTEVKIDELVSDTMIIMVPIAKKKEIRIDWVIESTLVAILDYNMISSVLQNLITNAIKFTQKGGQIVVKSFIDSNYLNFIVSDTGIGISEKHMDELFRLDKSTSSRGTNDEVGTGLGLIICKEFIEKHKGKIWVESVLGEGSRFCFSIPVGNKLG